MSKEEREEVGECKGGKKWISVREGGDEKRGKEGERWRESYREGVMNERNVHTCFINKDISIIFFL